MRNALSTHTTRDAPIIGR